VVWDVTERKLLERQLAQAQKLESIGQLAAGVAHEINTPIQYVGDNLRFFQQSFSSLGKLFQGIERLLQVGRLGTGSPKLLKEIESLAADADLEYLQSEVPRCLEQSLEGTEHIANIVRAMKEFSHPGAEEKSPSNLNRAIASTIQVSRSEWKYVAEVEADLQPDLPMIHCVIGELNQVFLNLIVNAAHAIADVVRDQPDRRGKITVSTRRDGDWVEIQVGDTGTGIPEDVRTQVFVPFYTTKAVGRGTGQGLAIAHSVVVKKHAGTIGFETEMGVGTKFTVRLPIGGTA